MKSILLIANIRAAQGGITTQVYELVESLKSEGIVVKIVSTHGSLSKRFSGILTAFKEAAKYDLILGVGCAYTGFIPIIIASIVSKIRNKKLILNFHDGQINDFMKKYYGIIKIIIQNELVVVATKYLFDTFNHYGFKSVLINNHFNNLKLSETKKLSSDKIKIIWARSFEDLYRVDLALEAAKYFENHKNVEFHFYGSGSNYHYFKDIYSSENIYFHGSIKREALLNEYSEYDIFLNTTEYDNFPMSIVEAGLNKLVVITSNVGGITNLYKENEVVYFNSGDIESLKSNLNKVIDNISLYIDYSNNLYQKVLTFNWQNVRLKWLKLLTD